MALIDLGTHAMRYPANLGYSANTWGFNGQALDAAEEAVAFVFIAPWTGTLKKVHWFVSTNTSVAANIKVQIESPSTSGEPLSTTIAGATLFHASASTDVDVSSATIGAQVALSTNINGTTGISVTRGDLLAVVFRMSAITSGAATIAHHLWGRSYGQNFPYLTVLTTGSWTAGYAGNTPCCALTVDDVVVSTPPFVPIVAAQSTFLPAPTFNNTVGYRGIKFQVPFECKISGFYGTIFDLGADATIKMFSSSGSVTLPVGHYYSVLADQYMHEIAMYLFGADQTLQANTWYRIAARANSVTNSNIRYIDYSAQPTWESAFPWKGNGLFTSSTATDTPAWDTDWTDTNYTDVPMQLLISAVNDVAGGGGGSLYSVIGSA